VTRSETIARLNDAARKLRWGSNCRLVQTVGISALPVLTQSVIRERVATFDQFTKDNDPYGEHDFGSFDCCDGVGVYWKIDYYDRALEYGSEDPADPEKTTRVLTIMLREEY